MPLLLNMDTLLNFVVVFCFLLQDEALEVILNTAEKYPWDGARIAQLVKLQLDDRLGPSWHAAAGEAFGYELTYEGRGLISVLYGSLAVVAWKCGTVLMDEDDEGGGEGGGGAARIKSMMMAAKASGGGSNGQGGADGEQQQQQQQQAQMAFRQAEEDEDD